ncbi:Odorant receptor 9a [Formica fusca]
MSFYDNHYYYLNKRFLSIIGQWPFQSRLESNVMLAITLLFICSLTALEFLGLIAGITNMNIIMENTSPLLINSFIFVKLINSLCNKYKMKDLLERIEETWKITQIGPEKEILRNYAKQSRTLTIQYALALYSSWIFYSTMPIVVSEIYSLLPTNETYTARYLFRLEHVLDVDKYFNLLMLHGIISVFYIVSVPIAVDSMFVLCIQHACALFEGIKYKIQHIRGSDFVTLKPNIMDDEAFHVIIDCIKLYKRALKFSDLLSSTFETCFFFLLGNVVIALSFNAAELIMMDIQLDEIIRIVAANMGQLLHIFYLSFMSQRLIDHSSGLQEAIYSCEWYKISLRSRQLLRFTLMRVIKPCQIKAGKIYVMSMENFSSILKVSVSYFTMLTSMQ